MKNKIKNIICVITGIYLSAALILIFSSKYIDFYCKRSYQNYNALVLIADLLILLVIFGLTKKIKIKITEHNFDKWVLRICALVLLLKIYCSINIQFLTDWDAGIIYGAAFDAASQAGGMSKYSWYFSRYPNNSTLLLVEYAIQIMNKYIGLFNSQYRILTFTILNCIISVVACRYVYLFLKTICSEFYAFLGFGISVLLIGVSPWCVIPYSDSLLLALPVMVLYYGNRPADTRKEKILNGLLVILLSTFGYLIKPQAVIAFIALFLVKVFNRKERLRYLFLTAILALCIVLANKVSIAGVRALSIPINEDQQFGVMHFAMMGLNTDTDGIYREEDGDYSASFETPDERTSRDLNMIAQRLDQIGFLGLLKHLAKKTLVNYGDGTFAWGIEGTFYATKFEDINDSISPKLKSLFYTDDTGVNSQYFAEYSQLIWFFVLLLTTLSVFSLLKASYTTDDEPVYTMILSLVGISLFELIFEARARYLYIFSPVYCAAAAYGISRLTYSVSAKQPQCPDKLVEVK